MSRFDAGDDVVVRKDISTGWIGSVSKGTAGVVIRVNEGFFSTEYDVRSEGERGVIEDVDEDDLG